MFIFLENLPPKNIVLIMVQKIYDSLMFIKFDPQFFVKFSPVIDNQNKHRLSLEPFA